MKFDIAWGIFPTSMIAIIGIALPVLLIDVINEKLFIVPSLLANLFIIVCWGLVLILWGTKVSDTIKEIKEDHNQRKVE